MTQLERMLAGLPYLPVDDELLARHQACQNWLDGFNKLATTNYDAKMAELRKWLGACGKEVYLTGPFYCDYGFNISIGDHFFANYHLTILDVGKVSIGNHVLFGPNVAIYAVGHAIDPDLRKEGWEFGQAVTIADNVWLGGSVVVNPGVTIGADSIVGAGSVVVKDIPAGVIAAGNPAKVIRPIGPQDRDPRCREQKYK